ncbi:MAG: hypothetical protein NC489_27025 [Ruminococcus flavefaciens]|nr:hypothetical protein [Ruminococcus flavefaciens]
MNKISVDKHQSINDISINYKYSIGKRFKDNKRDIEIIDRVVKTPYIKSKKMEKVYICKCHICGDDTIEITEPHLNANRGCPTCHSKKVTKGINDLATTNPWMVPYFVNNEDTTKYTACSNIDVDMKCPFCNKIVKHSILKLYQNKKLPCQCSDSISYPEKFMISLLEQLHINFIYQLSSKNFSWCTNYRYDFYIPDFNMIIETDGLQHYAQTSSFFTNIDEIRNNDIKKEEIAVYNGVKEYIRIDCRKSDRNYIKNSIIKSNLITILGKTIDEINWELCDSFALKNIIKDICDYKKEHPFLNASEIAPIFHINRSTASRYLNRGAKLGWCIYGGSARCVEIYKDGKSLGIYKSAKDLAKKSLLDFNILFNDECIKRVCRNETTQYKGFTFKYVT